MKRSRDSPKILKKTNRPIPNKKILPSIMLLDRIFFCLVKGITDLFDQVRNDLAVKIGGVD